AAAKKESINVTSAIKPYHSLAHRKDVKGADGYGFVAEQNDLAVFPYFSLAAGLLTGKYRNLEDFEGVDRAGQLSAYANEDGLNLVEGFVMVTRVLVAVQD